MGQTKGFRYYLTIFIIATAALLIYATIDAISNHGFDKSLLLTFTLAPVTFTGFLYIFDRIIDFIFPKKMKAKKEDKQEYQNFLKNINRAVEENSELSIEDFHQLRISEKFQKALGQAYRIFKQGETVDLTLGYLSRKFKKNTREYIAINIVVNEVKKLMENS